MSTLVTHEPCVDKFGEAAIVSGLRFEACSIQTLTEYKAYSQNMYGTLLVACTLLASGLFIMSSLWSKNKFPLAGLTAIVTGGSQGLGLSVAKEFAAKGANVVIVAQNVPKLQTALTQIEKNAHSDKQRFLYLSYDLRSAQSGPLIVDEVTEWNGGSSPDIVFNCAGNCLPGFFASSSIETHKLQMDTTYWTCAYMAHAILQSWTKPAPPGSKSLVPTRHLIFTSSVAALFPLAGYAPYTPGKAAMRAMADTLNQEVEVYNGARANGWTDAPAADIKIHIAFPMGIQTPGFENEEKMKPALTRKLEEDDKPQQPDELAKILIAGLESGQYMITSNFIGHVMKGWGMGASQKTSIFDFLWTFLGSLIILFISPDFMSKCRKWGKENGMKGAK